MRTHIASIDFKISGIEDIDDATPLVEMLTSQDMKAVVDIGPVGEGYVVSGHISENAANKLNAPAMAAILAWLHIETSGEDLDEFGQQLLESVARVIESGEDEEA